MNSRFNFIYEIITIGLMYIAGSFLAYIIPIPGSLLGLSLFFILLMLKIIKIEKYTQISSLILKNLSFFFIPSAVQIIDSLDLLNNKIPILILILIISNILVLGVTARVVQYFVLKKEGSHD